MVLPWKNFLFAAAEESAEDKNVMRAELVRLGSVEEVAQIQWQWLASMASSTNHDPLFIGLCVGACFGLPREDWCLFESSFSQKVVGERAQRSRPPLFVLPDVLKPQRICWYTDVVLSTMMEITLPPLPPGSSGLLVSTTKGGCVVVETCIKQSELDVNDVIVSVNGIDYAGMAKMEDGKRAWVHLLFQHNVERRLVVLRKSEKSSPLKDRSNLQHRDLHTTLKEDNVVATSTLKTSKVTWRDEQLLRDVVSKWTRGEGKRQNSEGMSAIHSCLLYGISPNDIARHVAGNENDGKELNRARQCAKRINKSMKKQRDKLLTGVANSWTTGKANCQTSQCREAIRSCLLAGMSPLSIARHVANQVIVEDEAREYKRAEACAKRIETNIATEKRAHGCAGQIKTSIKPLLKKGVVTSVELEERMLVFNLSSEFEQE